MKTKSFFKLIPILAAFLIIGQPAISNSPKSQNKVTHSSIEKVTPQLNIMASVLQYKPDEVRMYVHSTDNNDLYTFAGSRYDILWTDRIGNYISDRPAADINYGVRATVTVYDNLTGVMESLVVFVQGPQVSNSIELVGKKAH